MQEVDPDLHQSLIWTLENDIEDVMDFDFTVDYEEAGEVISHDLVPNGASQRVTNANKAEFVRLLVEFKLSRGTQKQMTALMHGLHEIIPRPQLLVFNERELEYLLCGSKQVDLVHCGKICTRVLTLYDILGRLAGAHALRRWLQQQVICCRMVLGYSWEL